MSGRTKSSGVFQRLAPGSFGSVPQLVVRENQSAVFVRDGKALDDFGPGRHTLSTNNIPLLGGLIGAAFGGKSPFTAEVFFVSTRELTGLKWGTPQPMTFKDSQLGMVRLRAFGTFSIRVSQPDAVRELHRRYTRGATRSRISRISCGRSSSTTSTTFWEISVAR